MERVRKARGHIRATVTRTCNEANVEFAKDEPDLDMLRVLSERMTRQLELLGERDQDILDDMLDVDATEDEMTAEEKAIEGYQNMIALAKIKTEKLMHPTDTSTTGPSSTTTTVIEEARTKKQFKLPKIELRKFNGELIEWLGFWSQFQKIHEDKELHASDKIQYLVQAMIKGTRARDLVDSYPQTADNYPKVVAALKDRFGNESLLVEVYTRELQRLVIQNVSTVNQLSLSQMFDKLESHLRALETLGCTTKQNASMLYPMVESSLPEDVLRAWHRSPLSNQDQVDPDKSRLDFLMEFLQNEIRGEQRILLARGNQTAPAKELPGKKKSKDSKPKEEDIPTAAGLLSGEKIKCIFCERSHESKDCIQAQGLSLEEKDRIIRDQKFCFICLRTGHSSKFCKAFVKCVLCSRKHPVLMCPDLPSHRKGGSSTKEKALPEQSESSNSMLACSSNILLKTLMVTIVGVKGKKTVRVLLDDGSQRSYILRKLAEELELKSIGNEAIIHALFGGTETAVQRHRKFRFELRNICDSSKIVITALDQPKICGNIPRLHDGPWIHELKRKNIQISDVGSDGPEIEILLGAEDIANLLTGRTMKLAEGLLAVQTTLGWTIMGSFGNYANIYTSMMLTDSSIADLWTLEAIGIKDPSETLSKTEKEEAAREHFRRHVSRLEDGRYSVSLPWTTEKQVIPCNRAIAQKRLETATKKLKADGLYEAYESLFCSWEMEGIIEEVQEDNIESQSHYLPHRAVYKPESETTPIRPVFDASCKSSRSPSLNDCLEKGPNLMELIPSVLLRFREKRIGLISDIRKAFQMIENNPEDRDYLRFLWWKDSTQRMTKIFRHRRVVFGVNSSPFLLASVIEYHLSQVDLLRKPIADQLLKSLYVDNCVTSVDSLHDYEYFKEEASALMAEAQMELRLWQRSFGEESGVGSTPVECGLETAKVPASSIHVTSVLGLLWNKYEDTLSLDLNCGSLEGPINKRKVLSLIQQVFDPIGFSSPATLHPKLLVQKLWGEKIGWDEEFSSDRIQNFKTWYEDLKYLSEIKIPRIVSGHESEKTSWQLHTFGDASGDAYAAVVFLRAGSGSEVTVQLLQAKSRVAPLKKTTIPRLELLSCTISAILTDSVKKALSLEDVPCFYWTDSTTALAWIRRNDEWGTFVGNRVRTILKFTEAIHWNHIPGTENPADLPSRGCTPSQLLKSAWWEGPQWLKGSSDTWPSSSVVEDEEEIQTEKKKSTVTGLISVESDSCPWYCKQSLYKRNIICIAWLRRFIAFLSNRHNGRETKKSPLSVKEIKTAELNLLRLLQQDSFSMNESVIEGLKVERKQDGLLHVKTKITYRNDTEGFRYPLLLPNNHVLVDQIIRSEHFQKKHAGVQIVMGNLRERFWIIQGRRAIRRVLNKCVFCKRYTSSKPNVVPAPLPMDRVKTSRVFEVVGVDFAGPLFLKNKEKAWIALFTCAVYRCIHLELVQSLSTEAFMDAFSCFVSRRGRPEIVYSDNGTNFVGTNNALRELDWDRISKEYGLEKIVWKFNPPSAPWWGGWWERLVRSVKDLLRRTLRKSTLSFEKLRTLLCEVEAVINGRPLTTVTEDPDDLMPLTPSMFMHEMDCPSITDRELLDASGFRKMYKKRKSISDDLKLRFRREYLALLVHRGKEKPIMEFKIGDIVLVGADNKKRWEWPMGRIVELIPGKDGCVRVAKIKTAMTILTRPLQHVYALEVSSSEDRPEVPKKSEIEDTAVPVKVQPREIKTTRSGRQVKAPARYGH